MGDDMTHDYEWSSWSSVSGYGHNGYGHGYETQLISDYRLPMMLNITAVLASLMFSKRYSILHNEFEDRGRIFVQLA